MNKEYRQPDADGRINLSAREYQAIRAIYGTVHSLDHYHKELERRCKGYKNGWRDLRCLVALSEKVLTDVLRTVPTKKLMQMQKDLDHTICRVETKGVVGIKEDGYMFVPEDSVINMCELAMKINCFGCDKTHKEAKRTCKLYKELTDTFAYSFDDTPDCPFIDNGLD